MTLWTKRIIMTIVSAAALMALAAWADCGWRWVMR